MIFKKKFQIKFKILNESKTPKKKKSRKKSQKIPKKSLISTGFIKNTNNKKHENIKQTKCHQAKMHGQTYSETHRPKTI